MSVSHHNAAARQALIDALSRGASVTAAAAEAGLNRSHAYRLRRQDPRVAAVWPPRRGRSRLVPGAIPADQAARERAFRAEALEVLARLAADEATPARDRVSAAKVLVQLEPPLPPPVTSAPEEPEAELTTAEVAEVFRYRKPEERARA